MSRQIDEKTWQRLQARANAQNLSVDELLNDLLDEANAEMICNDHMLDAAPSSILITDARQPDHPIVFANATFEQVTGYSQDETLGYNCRFLQNDDRDQPGIDQIRSAVERVSRVRCFYVTIVKTGQCSGMSFASHQYAMQQGS